MKNIKDTFFPEGISELNDFNRNMIDSAPMSIMVVNKNGNIVFVNQFFKEVSAEKRPFLKNLFNMKFFNDLGLCDDYKELLKTGKILKKENCPSLNGKKYFNIVAIPLKNKDGEIDGALSMALDVTETALAKLKLNKLNSELEEKVLQKTQLLYEANKKLEKVLEVRSKFISDASHELRTPLTIAKLNLEFYRKQFSDNDVVEAMTLVDNEINKVSDILSDISFFTKIDENPDERNNTEKIDLLTLIENCSKRLKVLADEKNIDIIIKNKESNLLVSGDKAKLEKLFLNIIGNAIKYGKKSGWIKIGLGLDAEKKSVIVIISDNGIGISKKDLPYIFDRFYRANLSKKRGEGGFGLGLAICKWIVDKHYGSIDVKSTLNRGTIFTIKLPLGQNQPSAEFEL